MKLPSLPKLPISYIRGFLCCLWLIATLLNLGLAWWNIRTVNDHRRFMFVTLKGEDEIRVYGETNGADFVKTVAHNK